MPSFSNSIIDNIPHDIWRTIFAICTADHNGSSVEFHFTRAPLLLCLVSSTWRAIAVSAPELWTNNEIFINGRGYTSANRELVAQAFALAKGLPLNLVLRGEAWKSNYDIGSGTAPFLLEFLSNIHRARNLEIDVRPIHQISFSTFQRGSGLEAILGQGAPLLEKLTIWGGTDPSSRWTPASICMMVRELWTPASRLHTLTLRNFSTFYPSVSITEEVGVCFDRLATLDIDLRAEDLLEILSTAKNLIHCTAHITQPRPSHNSLQAPIHIPLLQVLDMTGDNDLDPEGDYDSPPLTEFIGHLRTPALTTLRLREDHEWSPTFFRAFLENSSCSVQHLSLKINDDSFGEEFEYLELLPNLKTLSVHSIDFPWYGYKSYDFNTAFVGKDVSKQQQFLLCPILEEIDIQYSDLGECSKTWTPFADMIESRFHSGSLQCLSVRGVEEELNLSADLSPSFEIIRLLVLKQRGLKVVLDPEPTWAILFR